jgi:hypothetical protein
VEAQNAITGASPSKRPAKQRQHSHPKNLLQITGEHTGRSADHEGSGHE